MATFTREQLNSVMGDDVISADGEKVGTVTDLYVDADMPEQHAWIGLMGGPLKLKHRFVPLDDASINDAEQEVQVPFTKDQIMNSPEFEESPEELDEERTRDLVGSYGRSWEEYDRGGDGYGREATGRTQAAGPRRTETTGQRRGDSVTRSEEELAIGKRRVRSGDVRLRKWVDTEPVSEDVTVTRQRADVRREPIDREARAGEIGEQEINVPLYREEPVADKRTVAKERISVDTDTEQRRETVRDELRKERVEVDEDQGYRGGTEPRGERRR